MFTGIVQTVGVVRSIQRGSTGARLVLDAPDLARPLPGGASVCVSGACLTVASADDSTIAFDIVPETLARSTIASWTPGRRVNLERSLRAGDPIDGHIVQGHIDGTARVRAVTRGSGGHLCTCAPEEALVPFIIPKGSIAIDGVSLTIADVHHDTFTVALIPTTLAVTTLGVLRVGDEVNVETDILARIVITTLQRWGRASPAETITVDMLRGQGYV